MFWKLGAGFLAVSMGATIPAAVVVHQQGIIEVEVHEKTADGTHLYIPVPMAFVHLALGFVPASELREAGAEVRQYRELVAAVTATLADCPDGTLVDVVDGRDAVRVVKLGGRIEVHIDNDQEMVDVKIPLQGVNRVVQKLAEAAD